MKQLFVKDLKKGDAIFGESFAVKNYKKSATRTNRPYADLELADSTGTINGKVWSDDLSNCKEPSLGDVITINGTVEDFQGKLQMRISSLEITTDFNEKDFIQKSKNNASKMEEELDFLIKEVKNSYLNQLLLTVFNDDFKKDFIKAAGAFRVHHAYSGGLLEHTLEIANIAKSLIERFPKASKDIIIAGALLHDLGKVFEYKVGSTINITKDGKLLGHIFIGTEFVKSKAQKIDSFPNDLLNEILHIMLSHHGQLEYGSPVRPMTVEAIIISVSDKSSADVNMAYNTIHEGNLTDEFSEYHRHLGTELYRSQYLTEDSSDTLF